MIRSLKKFRVDGKFISEDMTLDEIARLGPASLTVAAEWEGSAGPIKIANGFGLWVNVLPRRDAIAVIEAADEAHEMTTLRVINEDGSERCRLSNYQLINGVDRVGIFCWFDKTRTTRLNCFSVVFMVPSEMSHYQLDIDGINGEVVGVYPTR